MTTPVVILAGGRGARFDHESQVRPKPLIEVAGKPILGHIMDLFEVQGFDEFIILGGYLCDQLSDYLATRYTCRDTVKTHPYITVFGDPGHDVKCHLFDTGTDATTGDRIFSLEMDFMPRKAPYFLTYGDGLTDVDLRSLLEYHGQWSDEPRITVTAVRPPGRFGVVGLDDSGHVHSFGEKPIGGWINGGFMVVDRGFVPRFVPRKPFDGGPYESFESGAMVRAAEAGRMSAWMHSGYWRCMDTRRDLEQIEEDVRAAGGRLPWRRDMMEGK